MNNPIRYSDPTGHVIEDGSGSSCGEKDLHTCKVDFLHRKASDIVKSLKGKDDRNDLEAMIDIVDWGAILFDTYDELIPALSEVFLGIEESNSLTILNAAQPGLDGCAAVGRAEWDCSANVERGSFLDFGFHEDFRDHDSQPFHFWAYLATAANTEGIGPASYIPGRIFSNLGNNYHEIWRPDGAGATWQDYALARAGMNIGTLVNMGMVPPNQLGNTIKSFIGPSGPGAPYVDIYKSIWPLKGNK